jgi:hypothetical protein
VTAKTKDGKEIYRESKIYMPVPQQLGRGDRMGRGPYEKSGILEDTGLPPNRTVRERFDILFPFEDTLEGGARTRKLLDNELLLEVKLWYLPYGTRNADPFLWSEFTRKVSIEEGGK